MRRWSSWCCWCCYRMRYRRRRAPAAAAAAAIATTILILLAHQHGIWQNTGGTSGVTIQEKGPPPPELGLRTWVVVDAEGAGGAQVCDTVARRYPGWAILIYGTDKPDRNSLSRCRYYPPTNVSQGDHVPPPAHLSTQRQALLYAIQNGAEAVYIPRVGAPLSGPPPSVFTDRTYRGLHYTSSTSSSHHFNAAYHFGCRITPHARPAGSGAATYRLCQGSPPAMQVLSWLPTAPTFTVTQEATHRKLTLPHCDLHAPPVTLDKDILGDFLLHEALYTKAAFWALAAVEEVETESGGGRMVGSGGSGDLVVGYAIQRLLGLSGHHLLMRSDQPQEGSGTGGGDDIYFVRGSHSQFQHKAVQTIRQWQCPAGTRGNNFLKHCICALFTHLGALKLLPAPRVTNMVAWWDALEVISYQQPPMGNPSVQNDPMGGCIKDPVLYRPVGLHGKMEWSRYRPRPTMPLGNELLLQQTLNITCSRINSQSSSDVMNPIHPGLPHKAVAAATRPPVNLTHPWTQFQSVTLIVTFNLPHYDVIPYLELLYRPFFPYIVYCGPGVPDPLLHPHLSEYNLTFVSYSSTPGGHFPGSFNYQCVPLVVGLGLDVAGYLVISDDVYLSLTWLTELSLNAAWFLPRDQLKVGDLVLLKECRLGMCDFGPHWRWWEDYQSQTLSALSYLATHHHTSRTLYRCHKQLVALTGSTKRAMGTYSDVYYIPQRLATDFSTILDVFLQHQVFLEIAMPSTLLCLELPEHVVPINGLRVWDDTRDDPAQHFNAKEYLGKTFLHPTKWSGLPQGSLTTRDFYCNKILPHLHDPYGRFQKPPHEL